MPLELTEVLTAFRQAYGTAEHSKCCNQSYSVTWKLWMTAKLSNANTTGAVNQGDPFHTTLQTCHAKYSKAHPVIFESHTATTFLVAAYRTKDTHDAALCEAGKAFDAWSKACYHITWRSQVNNRKN